jgi:hypothetical protein
MVFCVLWIRANMRKAQRLSSIWHPGAAALVGFVVICSPLCGQSSQEAPPPQPGQVQQPSQAQQPGAPPVPLQIPNTESAPPFTVRDKFEYRVVQAYGLRGFVGAALSAGIGQWDDSPHEWGEGFDGYAKRYGSAFAGNFSRQTFAWMLESAFHQDPRYFPSEDKNKKQRALNALKQVIVCKNDDGRPSFAYARVFSDFGAAQLENVWQPRSTSSVGAGFKRGFIGLGADAAYNLMQEFIPFTRPISLRHRH